MLPTLSSEIIAMVEKSQFASIEQLARITVFQDLPTADLVILQPHTLLHPYQKAAVVMLEGDRLLSQLYILLEGELQLTRIGTSGKETLLRNLFPSEIFAAPALVGDGIAPTTVIASIESLVLTVKRSALLEQIRQTPEVALRILEVYNQRLQKMHRTMHDLVSERAIVRLAHLIQDRATEFGTISDRQGDRLKIDFSHHQTARTIGISYAECVRLFSQLKSVVSYQRGGKTTILDWDILNSIADGKTDLKTLAIRCNTIVPSP
jgi:CRP/FNR family transcriptional regulator, cyclic AMP receptor protein